MNGMSKWYFRISHRVAVKKCVAIITISEFSRSRIHEKLRYPKDKIWLIYCGIDTEWFAASSVMEKKIREKYNLPEEYILSVSTLEPRKNLQLLIRAYTNLMNKKMILPKLVLSGRKGWKMEEFFMTINQDVKNNIVFTGFIDDIDLPVIYSLAKFFVFPSIYEGFGMPPLEAMSCGTLTLSSDAASLPEILGNTAIYFTNNDIDDLEKKLIYLCNIPNTKREDIIFKGLERCHKYNWENEAETLISNLSN